MKKLGLIFLVISVVSLLLFLAARLVIGGWQHFLVVPLFSFLVFFILSSVMNFKSYLKLLTLKTSKHGMALGVLIIAGLILLASINFVAVKSDISWDLTQERLYTLSDESIKLVEQTKQPITAKILYRNSLDLEKVKQINDQLHLYKEQGLNLTIEKINILKQPEVIDVYLKFLSHSQNTVFLFFDTIKNKIQIHHPFLEEQITQGLVKVDANPSKVYFLYDHQEWSLTSDSSDPFGLSIIKASLQEFSTEVVAYSINESGLPEKESVIVSVGAKSFFTKKELQLLEQHLKHGGKFIAALDPGLPHNLTGLFKKANIEFKNNFIKDPLSRMGQVALLTQNYAQNHPISKMLLGRSSLFNLASEVVAGRITSNKIKAVPLIFTTDSSYAVGSLSDRGEGADTKAHSIAVISEGRLGLSEKHFKMLVFGDSDFFRNELIQALANREVIINSITYLLGKNKLLNLPVKFPSLGLIKPTTVTYLILVLGSIVVPLLALLIAFFIWFFKRKGESAGDSA